MSIIARSSSLLPDDGHEKNMCTHVCSRVPWLPPFWQSFVTPNPALIRCVRTAHLDHSASVSAPVYLSSVHNQISSNLATPHLIQA